MRALADLFQAVLEKRADKSTVEAAKPFSDQTLPEDVARLIDDAIARDVGLEILKPAVSKLLNPLYDPLRNHRYKEGVLFFDSLLRENEGAAALLSETRSAVAALNASGQLRADGLAHIRSFVQRLGALEVHYLKKENILFPVFEATYPEYRCVRLMWSIHDDVRRSLRRLRELCEDPDSLLSDLNGEIGKLYFNIHAVIFREECIVFPILAGMVDKVSFDAMFEESLSFGFCFLEEDKVRELISRFRRTEANAVPSPVPKPAGCEGIPPPPGLALPLDSGALSLSVLESLFKAVPMDLTFVDAAGRVAWFSNGPHRIFPRSPSVIGRDVRNCHPRESVDRVVAILEDFRAGRRDREAFWLEHRGRFIHIEYFALRDAEDRFLGTLELSQDLTEKRGLEGEKRL
ncbi:MAG: PAS domain-containing protein [Desulfomicrobium escambiense]|nr:PAS domain-containing protein [Desulfomicrobium escambiense]